jgi:hypothetical protein
MTLKVYRYSDDALSIYDVMSADECAAWIERAEAQGFEAATVDAGPVPEIARGVRDNDRRLVRDHAWAAILWTRVAEVLPVRMVRWEAFGLNEQFRVYRYDRAQQFKWHFDGSYHRSESEESRLTFMIYLNEDFEGGFTEFETFRAWPSTGAALCFRHGLRHQGAQVLARSEERRVGKECRRLCRSRWSPYH